LPPRPEKIAPLELMDSMGKSLQRELSSRLEVLFSHLLK